MNRKMTVIAAVLWLAGLAAFIIGLNIKTEAGQWLTVAGEILFFVGLALEGVLYFRKQKSAPKDPEKEPEKEKPGDESPGSENA